MDQRTDNNKKNQIILGIIAIVILIALVGGTVLVKDKDDVSSVTTTSDTDTMQDDTTATKTDTTSTNASYKNGTYNATGSYNTPGGSEEIGVSITINNNAITAATVTEQATSSTAKDYQELFIEAFKSQVIGKSVDNVNVSKVSGSSLTSRGFNNAITQIKDQAKA